MTCTREETGVDGNNLIVQRGNINHLRLGSRSATSLVPQGRADLPRDARHCAVLLHKPCSLHCLYSGIQTIREQPAFQGTIVFVRESCLSTDNENTYLEVRLEQRTCAQIAQWTKMYATESKAACSLYLSNADEFVWHRACTQRRDDMSLLDEPVQ